MSSLYQHTNTHPFHISVGAVLVNGEGKVAAHVFSRETLAPSFVQALGSLNELHILMRESLEENETLEQAVMRGIREEFGAEGEVQAYLGSIQGRAFDSDGATPFEKTTLYFQVALTALGERPADDGEAHSSIVWFAPEALREKMQRQGTPLRGDIDESKIIDAYLKYGKH